VADWRVRVVRAAGAGRGVRAAARRSITEKDLRPGIRIAGAQVFVQEALSDGAQALVY